MHIPPQRYEGEPLAKDKWTEKDEEACSKESWGLFDAADGRSRCAAIIKENLNPDEVGFKDDYAALQFIRRRATEGSAYHQKALRFHTLVYDAGMQRASVCPVLAELRRKCAAKLFLTDFDAITAQYPAAAKLKDSDFVDALRAFPPDKSHQNPVRALRRALKLI